MWSTHCTITKVKSHELNLVQKYLNTASHELKERAEDSSLTGKDELSSTITAWLNYERRIKEVPEWPYNASIIRRLAASTVVPAIVYLLKIFSGLGLPF
jgi:hypothetical protein